MASTWPSITSMAPRSTKAGRLKNQRARLRAVLVCLLLAGMTSAALACPFCTALAPTLAQRRAAAKVTALAEVRGQSADRQTTLDLHRVLDGQKLLGNATSVVARLDGLAKPGGLVLLFGTPKPGVAEAVAATTDAFDWHAVAVNEATAAYFFRAPPADQPASERLKYFAPFLEHADATIAEDAYLEFGHTPFDVVAQVAPLVPVERVRDWLVSAQVPEHRKGFYGLLLGLSPNEAQRQANARFLRQRIESPEDDFRAGFDGLLGGYLLLAPQAALELIESKYLANPQAADGDVRHALTALRFYHEFGRELPKARLNEALARLLARREFAEAAIVDLARWQAWEALPQVVALYPKEGSGSSNLGRAVVGYLLACPTKEAAHSLRNLRKQDPRGVAEAEEVLRRTTGLGVKE